MLRMQMKETSWESSMKQVHDADQFKEACS